MTRRILVRPPPEPGEAKGLVLAAPPSKSAALRALLLAAFAGGGRVGGFRGPEPGDVERFVAGLGALGYVLRPVDGGYAAGPRGRPPEGPVELDAGEGAAPARFLLAAAALESVPVTIRGAARLSERPFGPLIGALSDLGARLTGGPGLPVTVRGPVRGGGVSVDGALSSQFASALLLAAPRMPGGLHIRAGGGDASRDYLDLTRSIMESFGVRAGPDLRVAPGAYRPADFHVEPDWSAATILLASAAFLGRRVLVPGLSLRSLQPDRAFADAIARMGMRAEQCPEGVAASGAPGFGGIFPLTRFPDSAPALLALGTLAPPPAGVEAAPHLRLKECDRIAAMAALLTAAGARVVESEGGLRIEEGIPFQPAARAVPLETRGDHRMVMAAALIGLRRPVEIENPQAADKSFPGFFDQWPAGIAELPG